MTRTPQLHQPTRNDPVPVPHRRRATRLGLGLIVLGIGIAVAAVLGPLVTGVIEYHVIHDVLNQVKGGDLIGLALVAPVAIVAGILVLRGNRAGMLLGLAPAAYGAYTSAQLSLGGEFVTVPGNSERFFPLFLCLFVIGCLILIDAWRSIPGSAVPLPSEGMRRTAATVVLLMAAFLTLGLHARGLADVLGGAPFDVDYTQSPTVFWIVKLMDLGIVVPIAIATGVGLIRRAPWAPKAMYALIGWGALLGSAVAGMAIVMQASGDPAASMGTAIGMTVFAAAFLGLAGALFRPMFRPIAVPDGTRPD